MLDVNYLTVGLYYPIVWFKGPYERRSPTDEEGGLMSNISTDPQPRFEELLAQARAGSHEAYQALIDPFERVLRRRSRRRTERRLRGKISDSDLRQITYLQSFENITQFKGNTLEEFGCWL